MMDRSPRGELSKHSIRAGEPGKDWRVAQFTGQDTEYLLTWSCCENPECLCRDMTFVFTSLDEEGDDDAGFHATLNIDTWEESKPYQRPAWAESCAREFMTQLTEELKTEFREYFNAGKKHGRKTSEFRIEPSEIMDGRRVAYSEVVGDRGSILKGGQSHWMTFRFEGVDYIVEDLYCMNPACHCRDALIVFLEVQQSPPELPRIRDAFDATMTLKGVAKVVEAVRTDIDLAGKVLRAWKEHEDVLSVIRIRYKEMKAIGRRNLEAESAFHDSTFADDSTEEDLVAESPGVPVSRPAKVGRNEPCPCGSGKKYKKCCGR